MKMYKFWETVQKYEREIWENVWTRARNGRNNFQFTWNYKCEHNGTERLKSKVMKKIPLGNRGGM